ncbi:hypothetical protein GP486_006896 [Trichoglossum hirsutum]|uniref:ADF-H domain-containing protein n=1 Tax=Trichoglossum hirsutum TaxID=265104 RepID=A0A9P8ICR6_9PEZI|nr:hypothetical protein GP486_006896 [Trichoglossum hirsutum]
MDAFRSLKDGSHAKCIIFKLSGPMGKPEIALDDKYQPNPKLVGDRAIWDEARKYLEGRIVDGKEIPEDAESTPVGARYVVFDLDYKLKGGEGSRRKIVLVNFVPSGTSPYWKTIQASSVNALKDTLSIANTAHADSGAEFDYATILRKFDPKADLGDEA